MLSKLTIKGFQSHRDTTFEFHEGLNAVIGSSDSGKSSVLRAISWLLFNTPRGDGFVSWWDDVTKTSVEGVFDDTIITKTRSKTLNQYQINKGEPLKALRTDVPDEIKAVLNVSDLNLQKQHDSYFLLQDTPSSVASKFNEIAGLQVMDECVSQAKSLNRSLKQESDVLFEQINSSQLLYNDLYWIEEAEKHVNEAALLEESILVLKDKHSTVHRLCDQIEEVQVRIRKIDMFVNMLDAVQEAIDTYTALAEKAKRHERVKSLVQSNSEYSTDIHALKLIINDENSIIVDTAISLYKQIADAKSKAANVQTLLSSIESTNALVSRIDLDLSDMQKTFDSSMSDYSICPLCECVLEKETNEAV